MQKDYLLLACVRQINNVHWIKLLLRYEQHKKDIGFTPLNCKVAIRFKTFNQTHVRRLSFACMC
jgi:hypothetical protein